MGNDVDPATEIFRDFGNEESITKLIAAASVAPSSAVANRILITAMFYLAENLRRNGVASQTHAESLTVATRSLVVATRALVVATVLLGAVALLRLFGVG